MEKNISDQTHNPSKTSYLPFFKTLQYLLIVSLLLYLGRTLFIPLSFALLISFVLYPVCAWLEKHGVGRTLAIFICISLLVILFFGIITLFIQQLINFTAEWPALKIKLEEAVSQLSTFISEKFNFSKPEQQAWLKDISTSSSMNFLTFIQNTLYSSSVFLVLAILIPIFSALMLFYRKMLTNVLTSLFPRNQRDLVVKILHETVHTYYSFIKGMGLVYLIVGLLNSVGLLIIGIPHPFLFGFIVSILTFIPYVGIVAGSILPIAVAWLTYNSIWYPVAVVALFTVVQYLEANLIFPMAVSSRLKINTLVTLAAIILGGIIWGASGMILFIPFLAMLKLIADNAEGMEGLATLLGTKNK